MAKANNAQIVLKDNIHELYLRKSLFWDVPVKKLDLNTNRRLIIERVFSRGNIHELKQLLIFTQIERFRSID